MSNSYENVLGVMLLRRPKSLGRYDLFAAVVTTQRMIFAQITKEMVNEAIKQAKEQAKAEGKGFWGQWASQLSASSNYAERYRTMEPAAILRETPGNFAFNNDTIHEIKLELKRIDKGDPRAYSHEFEIEISSTSGKNKFRTDEKEEYVKLLRQVYGERVKTPFGYSHSFKIH